MKTKNLSHLVGLVLWDLDCQLLLVLRLAILIKELYAFVVMLHFFYNKNYSGTCLRKRKSCRNKCKFENGKIPSSCPPYTPDFVKLAESYGAYGIRVDKEENISSSLENAKLNTDAPTIIEILIDYKENVLPIVQGGKSLKDMIINED